MGAFPGSYGGDLARAVHGREGVPEIESGMVEEVGVPGRLGKRVPLEGRLGAFLLAAYE